MKYRYTAVHFLNSLQVSKLLTSFPDFCPMVISRLTSRLAVIHRQLIMISLLNIFNLVSDFYL